MFKKILVVAGLSMLSTIANATPISNSVSGLASPALTITFDEHLLPAGSSVTNEYSDLGVTFSPNLYYSSYPGFPNNVTNFGSGPNVFQFSLNFLTNQTDVAFAMVSRSSSWNFEALLGNLVVESFLATVDLSAFNFFGFTGIAFDEIRITSSINDLMIIDNLQLSKTNNVPEPTSIALLGLGLAGLGAARQRVKSK